MTHPLFRRVRKPCTGPYGCGKRVQTLAYVEAPVCQGCRRRLRNLDRQPYHMAERRRQTNEARRDYWREYKRQRRAA